MTTLNTNGTAVMMQSVLPVLLLTMLYLAPLPPSSPLKPFSRCTFTCVVFQLQMLEEGGTRDRPCFPTSPPSWNVSQVPKHASTTSTCSCDKVNEYGTAGLHLKVIGVVGGKSQHQLVHKMKFHEAVSNTTSSSSRRTTLAGQQESEDWEGEGRLLPCKSPCW